MKDHTWPTVPAGTGRMLIVPLGSIEQHGPHLPLDTDGVIALALATEIHESRTQADLTPLIPLAASGEHSGFAGTLSIGTDAMFLMLIELVRDAERNWDSVLLVNGHGGNASALKSAISTARSEGRRVAVTGIFADHGDAHAGRTETSLMLFLDPERVVQESYEVGNPASLTELLPLITSSGVRAVSHNGILGDPRGASAAEGEAIFKSSVQRALAVCDALDSAH